MGFKQGPDFRDREGLKHQREGHCFLQCTSSKRKNKGHQNGKIPGHAVIKDGWFPTSQFTTLTLCNTANISRRQGNGPPRPGGEKVSLSPPRGTLERWDPMSDAEDQLHGNNST